MNTSDEAAKTAFVKFNFYPLIKKKQHSCSALILFYLCLILRILLHPTRLNFSN